MPRGGSGVREHTPADVSPVPLGSKGAHDHLVEWSAIVVKHGEEAQPAPARPAMTYGGKRKGLEDKILTYL